MSGCAVVLRYCPALLSRVHAAGVDNQIPQFVDHVGTLHNHQLSLLEGQQFASIHGDHSAALINHLHKRGSVHCILFCGFAERTIVIMARGAMIMLAYLSRRVHHDEHSASCFPSRIGTSADASYQHHRLWRGWPNRRSRSRFCKRILRRSSNGPNPGWRIPGGR